jgi:hypothetical protein
MPKLTLALTMFALISLDGAALAETDVKDAVPTPIEKVLDANPEPNGKAYRINLQLRDGTRVAYEIPASEAVKIADGLSKPAIAGGQNRQVATLLDGMTVQVDSKGEAVILGPRSRSGALERLAIPISGANLFVKTLQAKIVEAKTIAAKQRK